MNEEDLLDWDTAVSRASPTTPNQFDPYEAVEQRPQKKPSSQQPSRQAPPQVLQQNVNAKKPPLPKVLQQQGKQPKAQKKRMSNICVAVRKRPLSTNEKTKGDSDVVEVLNTCKICVHEPKYVTRVITINFH